jgi:predicted dehydrogenase
MTPVARKIRVIVAGAGDRGGTHAGYALQHPEEVEVVGVAEPREYQRMAMADAHGIQGENVFTDWREMADRERFADAVLVTTSDAMHVEPVKGFAEKGYHIMLEKPMAPTPEECRAIIDAVKANDVILSVGHVLRYTPYTRTVKKILDAGTIGEIVCIQRLEPLGYWHQAHSFVRGNWRNEAESSFMLLAKCCHDIDWLHYIMGKRCTSVSSFGSLKHFRASERPEGAADHCLECSVEAECPYSARKIYMGRLARGETSWPLSVVDPEATPATLEAALRDGPYGRCVYACDNDVVDNQVVNMQFEGGATASFTMTCFNQAGHRRTNVFGTRGEIRGTGDKVEVFDFMTDKWSTVEVDCGSADVTGGHGGGDTVLMERFVAAVASGDQSLVLSGPDETLESHLIVFGAEKARKQHCVVDL